MTSCSNLFYKQIVVKLYKHPLYYCSIRINTFDLLFNIFTCMQIPEKLWQLVNHSLAYLYDLVCVSWSRFPISLKTLPRILCFGVLNTYAKWDAFHSGHYTDFIGVECPDKRCRFALIAEIYISRD